MQERQGNTEYLVNFLNDRLKRDISQRNNNRRVKASSRCRRQRQGWRFYIDSEKNKNKITTTKSLILAQDER